MPGSHKQHLLTTEPVILYVSLNPRLSHPESNLSNTWKGDGPPQMSKGAEVNLAWQKSHSKWTCNTHWLQLL